MSRSRSFAAFGLSALMVAGVLNSAAFATNTGTDDGVTFTGTIPGGGGCAQTWNATTVLDLDLTNDDEHYPGLMTGLNGSPVDYSNGGYISEVSAAFGNPGQFEANHWYDRYPADHIATSNTGQYWRWPLATQQTIMPGAQIRVTLPETMTDITFSNATNGKWMAGWGAPWNSYTWDSDVISAVDQVGDHEWLLTLKNGLPAGHGTVFQFSGKTVEGTNLNDPVIGSAVMTMNVEKGSKDCPITDSMLPPLPEVPPLAHCQHVLEGRTVWAVTDRDITRREKYSDGWDDSVPFWGEVNADGWGVGADGWQEGSQRFMRLYGATDKDLQGVTFTATAAQGTRFVVPEGPVTINTPGGGQLQGNGYTNTAEGLGAVEVSEDGSTITLHMDKLPAKASFSFGVKVEVTGEVDDSGQPALLVVHEQLTGSDYQCSADVTTSEWTGPQPSCENPEVTEHRLQTTTPMVWDETKRIFVPGQPTSTEESRIVRLDEDAALKCSAPVPTPSAEPSQTPAPSQEPAPSPEPTAPAVTPSAEPTQQPTVVPSSNPVPTPSTEPTGAPSQPAPAPSAEPSQSPAPSQEPSLAPSAPAAPSAEPSTPSKPAPAKSTTNPGLAKTGADATGMLALSGLAVFGGALLMVLRRRKG